MKKTILLFFPIFGGFWVIMEPLSSFGLGGDFFKKLGVYGYILLVSISFIISIGYTFFSNRRIQTKITIAQFGKYLIYLPLYVAVKKGFFSEEKLEVEFLNCGGDDLTWNKVMNNDAQFGVADPVLLLNDKDRVRGKLIAPVLNKAAIWGVTDKKIPQIKNFKDFCGFNVSVFKDPSTQFKLFQHIKQTLNTNNRLKEIRLTEVVPTKEYNYIKDGSIDISIVLEPTATMAESDNFDIIFSGSKLFGKFLFTGVFTSEKYIKENPKKVQAFVNALKKSYEFIHNNHSELIKIAVEEFSEFKPLVIELATLRLLNEEVIPNSPIVFEEHWQNSLKTRFKEYHPEEYSFDDYVDNSFAKQSIRNGKKKYIS